MAYCVAQDVVNRLNASAVIDTSNDTMNSTTNDSTIISALITKASAIIDAHAGQIYTVPFATVPQLITELCADMVAYYLMQRRFSTMEMPVSWQKVHDEIWGNSSMKGMLDKISDEEFDLGSDAKVKSTESVMVTTRAIDVLNFNDTTTNISYY